MSLDDINDQFDNTINRIGTHSAKWDLLEPLYGVDPNEGIAMWVADMDFRPPQRVLDCVQEMRDHGIFGYYGDDKSYRSAIVNWMKMRHGWDVDPSHIFTTHGLVNGAALCLQTFTKPNDGVVIFTPVYHAFARVIKANNRKVVECELAIVDGRYEMDFDAYEKQMTGDETMLILCSPHNPGGRVWTQSELSQVADFCEKHDLILVSDEVHHDIVFGQTRHIPMTNAAPHIAHRLVMMTAASKTFNIAGAHAGNVIIADQTLREKFAATMAAGGNSPNSFGIFMTEAAYTGGANWVDRLIAYLDENRKIFDAGIAEIPGLKSMPLEATYLAWVDFSDTGMTRKEFTERTQNIAQVVGNHGTTFGKGGENFLRFNLGTQRSVVIEAVARLKDAFKDLQ
ncbi:aminotransferase [Amylibacter kogurei]|uniref:cysteine-S-conjugate beta-lyase n=1 Tax=Paramylibacter kogurei TaxID=1889778 RepID=A0A2G5K3D7_9RHOB|nr:MalY/PatB family protein [Amylibacter kogurei]PIB23244.1 aminotransferase [Amylibacter kogurei]